jgi:hypothetical protein
MSRRRWLLAALLAAPPALLLGWKGHHGFTTEPLPREHDYLGRGDRAEVDRGAYRSAAFCGGCHQEIYEQWQRSYLSKSWSQADIEVRLHGLTLRLRGMEETERRFCLECHAPLALAWPEDLEVEDPLAREGVTCVVCHTATHVWADEAPARMRNDPHGPILGPFDDAVSPWHATEAAVHFQRWDNQLCGSCHSSTWPLNDAHIDWTWQEWHEDAGPDDDNCVACHMPAYRGQAAQLEGVPVRELRDHSFPGGHDPDFVAEAMTLHLAGVERDQGNTWLLVDVENLAGHDLPSGNPPAPEYRLRACASPCPAEGGALDSRSYRASVLMADGSPTLDVTIAAKNGPSTALKAWELRRERLALPADAGGEIELRIDYSYWRPYEPSQRWPSYARTVGQHLANPEVSLGRLTLTLLRPQTWSLIAEAIGGSKGSPMPVDALRVDLDSGQITAQWSESGFALMGHGEPGE